MGNPSFGDNLKSALQDIENLLIPWATDIVVAFVLMQVLNSFIGVAIPTNIFTMRLCLGVVLLYQIVISVTNVNYRQLRASSVKYDLTETEIRKYYDAVNIGLIKYLLVHIPFYFILTVIFPR